MIATLGITLIMGLLFLGVVAFVVWLIVKRVQEKENETFEKRDN